MATSNARKFQRVEAFASLDTVVDQLDGVTLTRAAAIGCTSVNYVQYWLIERGHLLNDGSIINIVHTNRVLT